jgi:hypothetical protein
MGAVELYALGFSGNIGNPVVITGNLFPNHTTYDEKHNWSEVEVAGQVISWKRKSLGYNRLACVSLCFLVSRLKTQSLPCEDAFNWRAAVLSSHVHPLIYPDVTTAEHRLCMLRHRSTPWIDYLTRLCSIQAILKARYAEFWLPVILPTL